MLLTPRAVAGRGRSRVHSNLNALKAATFVLTSVVVVPELIEMRTLRADHDQPP